jgi:hypothetical protein
VSTQLFEKWLVIDCRMFISLLMKSSF